MYSCLVLLGFLLVGSQAIPHNFTEKERSERLFSLFSVVQFPNRACTSSPVTGSTGTCFTSQECETAGGTPLGNCAAGFGVCCVIRKSTCGDTITRNLTYVSNPNYPSSSYTATAASNCEFTVQKESEDICQLRLDFQSFSGFTFDGTVVSTCQDTFTAVGSSGGTGVMGGGNPPAICGTNTGYHMYVEFGPGASDDIKLKAAIAAAGISTAKTWNILTQQIPCNAPWRAPADCVQYYTGAAGTIQSFGFKGAKIMNSLLYSACIRTELGYCSVKFKQSTAITGGTDTFALGGDATNGKALACNAAAASTAKINIPGLTLEGRATIPETTVVAGNSKIVYDNICGGAFAQEGKAIPQAFITKKQPFQILVSAQKDATSTPMNTATGFSLDYVQLPC